MQNLLINSWQIVFIQLLYYDLDPAMRTTIISVRLKIFFFVFFYSVWQTIDNNYDNNYDDDNNSNNTASSKPLKNTGGGENGVGIRIIQIDSIRLARHLQHKSKAPNHFKHVDGSFTRYKRQFVQGYA